MDKSCSLSESSPDTGYQGSDEASPSYEAKLHSTGSKITVECEKVIKKYAKVSSSFDKMSEASPDTGYQGSDEATPSHEAKLLSTGSKITVESEKVIKKYAKVAPSFDKVYNYDTPDVNVLKQRKAPLMRKKLYDAPNTSLGEFGKLFDNLQKRPNQTMGVLIVGMIFFAAIITICMIGNLVDKDEYSAQAVWKNGTWYPSTTRGRRNGKYGSIEYAHYKRLQQNPKDLQVQDENGKILGGKQASIQFAYDIKNKGDDLDMNTAGDAKSDQDVEKLSNVNQIAEKRKVNESPVIDDEDDFYDSLQLLDDLKRMGDLLKQESSDSKPEIGSKESLNKNIKSGVAEETLKKLRALASFGTTKLQPLDLDYDNSKRSIPDPAKETDVVPVPEVGRKDDVSKKHNKSFKKLFKAYSAKVLRLVDKETSKIHSQNEKIARDEDDPFRFVQVDKKTSKIQNLNENIVRDEDDPFRFARVDKTNKIQT